MGRVLRPGPASMQGLQWLARVGPTPLEAWRCAMVWSEVAARRHARRLEDAGWLARYPMIRGTGHLLVATRSGIRTVGLSFRPTGVPAPTWWALHAARGWTAAWVTHRGHEFLGDRELAHTGGWTDRITWQDFKGLHHALRRPDVVAITKNDSRVPIEIALTRTPTNRLRATLDMYSRWRYDRGTTGVLYICRNQDIAQHVWNAVQRSTLGDGLALRLLDTIPEMATQACEKKRAARRAGAARQLAADARSTG